MNDYQKCLYAALELIRSRKEPYICWAVAYTSFPNNVKDRIIDYIEDLLVPHTSLEGWLKYDRNINLTNSEMREYRMMFILCLIEEVKDWKKPKPKFIQFVITNKLELFLFLPIILVWSLIIMTST